MSEAADAVGGALGRQGSLDRNEIEARGTPPPEAAATPGPRGSSSLSVIVPTKNEAANVVPLLDHIHRATRGLVVEVIFVDDSSDGTAEVVREMAARVPIDVVLVARPPERRNGLGRAVVEGMEAARHDWICVLDGDLQHPPEVIPQLLDHAFATGSNLVAASRLTEGGGTEGLSWGRTVISCILALISRVLFPRRLREVSDPLTGFFLVRRDAIDTRDLRPEGFKILLEVLVRSTRLRVSEIPFEFGERHAGASKANPHEALLLFRQMLRLCLLSQKHLARFLSVGASGVLVNSVLMALFAEAFAFHYLASAVLATQGSTMWNFGLSETWVFRERRSRPDRIWHRLAHFVLMNNMLLALRSPLLALGVTVFGVHYLWANLLSLFVVTLLRFAVSDRLIWFREDKAVQIEPVGVREGMRA
jgi:dolichol-phosphate mannosyltransferase